MNAPEKIYLWHSDRAGEEYDAEWSVIPWVEGDVEYTRTDAFIEKAADKLKQLMYYQHLFEGRLHQDAIIENFVGYFINYMKGE